MKYTSVEDILKNFGNLENANDDVIAFLDEVRAKQAERRREASPTVSWEVTKDGERVVLRSPEGKCWRFSRETERRLAQLLKEKASDG